MSISDMAKLNLARSLREYLMFCGVGVPIRKELIITTGSIDTEKQQLVIGYSFIELPEISIEEEND